MKVVVTRNTPQVNLICETDGRWVVTTHNRRIVKIQWVVEEIEGEDASDAALRQRDYLSAKYAGSLMPAAEVGGLISEGEAGFTDEVDAVRIVRATAQATVLGRMFGLNAQWLVTVSGGQIVSANRIKKPERVPEPEPESEPESEPKPKPKRRRRAKPKVDPEPDPESEVEQGPGPEADPPVS